MQSIMGFHANDKERCNSFVSNQSYLIVSEGDIDFLGTGMYFWTTKSDAKWWLEKKKKDGIVVRALLLLNDVLDLTDREVVNKISKLFEMVDKTKIWLANEFLKNYNKQISVCTGRKLDILFGLKRFHKYSVIKAHQKVGGEEADFFRNTRLTVLCRDIYLVKEYSVVTEREVLND